MGGLLGSLGPSGKAIQAAYISDNPNPLGSKHLLDGLSERTTWGAVHERVHPHLRTVLEAHAFYDIFLIDAATGDVIYSVFKELDFGSNVLSGPLASSGLGEAFRVGRDRLAPGESHITDLSLYRPSYDEPAGFIASPVFRSGQRIAVLVVQLPLAELSKVAGNPTGLGETGDAYLVGAEGLLRSDSVRDHKAHSVVAAHRDPSSSKIDLAWV